MTSFLDPRRYLTFIIVVFTILALAVANLRRGQTGRRFIAVRGNERAAASVGVDVGRVKVVAFMIGSVIASIGGVLIAYRSTAVTYTSFDVLGSVNQLVWTVIGGVGFVAGPLVGMGFAPGGLGTELAAAFSAEDFSYLPLIGGVLLLLTIILNPDGVASVEAERSYRRQAKKNKKTSIIVPQAPERTSGPSTPRRGLTVSGINMSFGAVHVLKSTSIAIEPGTVHGLIGPNGAGKSTLVDVISGFVKPQTGTVTLGDTPVDSMAVHARARLGIARAFQSLELFDDLNVFDNLQVAAELQQRPSVARDILVPRTPTLSDAGWDAVRLLGLEDDLDRRIGDLNYAKRRLVAIARAMATNSDIILLDEPAAGLDDFERAELKSLVRRMADEYGLGVLLIEHDVELVLGVSDVVTALNFGEIIASGRPEDVRNDPGVIAAYLGTDDPSSLLTTADTEPSTGSTEAS
jgi:sulfate-transporting ATPase